MPLPLKMVRTRLGHASVQMTADRYGHLFPSADDGSELAAAEKAMTHSKTPAAPARVVLAGPPQGGRNNADRHPPVTSKGDGAIMPPRLRFWLIPHSRAYANVMTITRCRRSSSSRRRLSGEDRGNVDKGRVIRSCATGATARTMASRAMFGR